MDRKQLMVGDLVNFNGTIDKVQEILYVDGKGYCASFAASATLFPVPLDKITPIPLTNDIIGKNGFHHNGLVYIYSNTNLYLYQQTGNIWEFGLFDEYGNGKGDPSSMKFCKIKYVHELQHILNLKFVDVEFII